MRIFKRGEKLQNVAQLPSNNWHHKKHAGPKGVSKENLFLFGYWIMGVVIKDLSVVIM